MKPQYFLLLMLGIFLISCSGEKEIIPLAEHPRPDFERAVWQNLNGTWQFKPDSLNVGLAENWQNKTETFESKIVVPFSWASQLSGVKMPKVNYGWYSRTFTIVNAESWKGKNIWLVFCASDFNTTVWVNGKEAGNHSGGYVPFSLNISDLLVNGENRLTVRVEDEELENRPSGKQYYGNAKGIWQTVYLEARSENFIRNVRFTPDIDKQTVTAEVNLAAPAVQTVKFGLKGKNNPLDFSGEIAAGSKSSTFTIPVTDMKLWSLDDPFLYEVTASVNGEKTSDEVSTYFGMRKISAVDIPGKDFKYVALNNEPVYMKLTLDQSYHPEGFYTFPSDQFMKEEIQRAKDLGLNGLRIHIKAEVPRKLYWADKLGLLIMEDIPNFWGEPDSVAKANWEYIAEQEMERDYNHPSIFSWVLFNETWGLFSKDSVSGKRNYTPETQEWVRSWYHKAKAFDPSRLVEDNSPCNWDHVVTDINTWHSYLPARHWAGFLDNVVANTYPGSTFNYIGGNKQGNEPMFNSECGAVWGYAGSTGDIDLTWEYHIMMNEFRKRPKVAGFLFTEFHDVINEWNGYYRFDRSKKMFGLDELVPGMTLNDFHADLYVIPGDDFYREYPGGETVQIPVGINAVTSKIPENLKIKYTVYGWNSLGEKVDHAQGEMAANAEAFTFLPQTPVSVTMPAETMVMILATTLEDGAGKILQRNFVPFRVKGAVGNKMVATRKPSEFAAAEWSVKYKQVLGGKKVWGMGSGYFEYDFTIPEGITAENTEMIEFRAELSSRYPQEKYLEDGDAEGIGMTIVSEKGTIPGYGKNSFPQTDEKTHGSLVTIAANNQKISQVELTDDPADHNGLLSWMNQVQGWDWGVEDNNKPWMLEEAGSYGYVVTASLDEVAKKSAFETGKIVIRLFVDEAGSNRGGLSVYGAESGKYPMDPSLIFKLKQ